jgi:hypothetical protein
MTQLKNYGAFLLILSRPLVLLYETGTSSELCSREDLYVQHVVGFIALPL